MLMHYIITSGTKEAFAQTCAQANVSESEVATPVL